MFGGDEEGQLSAPALFVRTATLEVIVRQQIQGFRRHLVLREHFNVVVKFFKTAMTPCYANTTHLDYLDGNLLAPERQQACDSLAKTWEGDLRALE